MTARPAPRALPELALALGVAELATAPDFDYPWFAVLVGVRFLREV